MFSAVIRQVVIRKRRWYSTVGTEYPLANMKAKIAPDGRSISLSSGESSYHVKWLRHNCQCPECLSTSGQKMVSGNDLHEEMTIMKASVNGESLIIVEVLYV